MRSRGQHWKGYILVLQYAFLFESGSQETVFTLETT